MGQPRSLDVLWPEVRWSLFFGNQTPGRSSGGTHRPTTSYVNVCHSGGLFRWNRCVVWTGDDRVFFFNPTMQLSVWEKPEDLEHRGDLNRILEDPPHKRKLEASAGERGPRAGPPCVSGPSVPRERAGRCAVPGCGGH